MRFNGSWSRVNTAGGNITASGNNDNSTSITDDNSRTSSTNNDNSIAINDDNSITTTTTTSSHPNRNSNVHSSISRNISSLNDLRDIHNSNRNRRNRSTTTTTTLVPNSKTRPNTAYQIANNMQSLRHLHRSSSSNNTDFRSSHRRSRRPMNSDDDDRSRSRNRNRNRNNTRQNTQTPTPTISIPSFNGIALAHGIDKREAENIYRIIHERSSIFCDNILEIIA
eukprot:533826_1